jgi:hypothetical protein
MGHQILQRSELHLQLRAGFSPGVKKKLLFLEKINHQKIAIRQVSDEKLKCTENVHIYQVKQLGQWYLRLVTGSKLYFIKEALLPSLSNLHEVKFTGMDCIFSLEQAKDRI